MARVLTSTLLLLLISHAVHAALRAEDVQVDGKVEESKPPDTKKKEAPYSGCQGDAPPISIRARCVPSADSRRCKGQELLLSTW